ncbi:response regulator [Photobacterium sagamiensis]|uniref:response regulator n=1 Tax=Photobacterium sagamiensis TaxID=2910241 RepID=UPI003D1357E8
MENKILVVEDSRPFRRVIEIELRKAGFSPVFAESIADAEKVLDENTDFLCAILDYCLPDGQDGEIIDVCLSVDIKVIVLTALMDERTREKVLAKTVIDYIPKDSPTCIASIIPILKRLENISAGVVNGDSNIHDLIGRADKCLYQAKTSGRNAIATE